MTRLLATVRETAARPIRYAELADRLAGTLPETPAEQVDRYLLGLVQNGVLLTSLRSDLLDELPHDGTCPESDTMRELRTRLRRYEERPDSAEGIEELRTASRTAKGLAETAKGAIQVDLDLGIRAAVPPGVLAEIESYASSMWRITPDEPSHPHMVSYFYAFMDRYGKYGAVRLEQLIDSHRGLGFPTGYRHPLVNSRVFPDVTGTKDELRQARREEHVAVLLHSGLTHPDGEVVLDESDVELLADSTQAPPYDMDLCFQLRARDTDALNAGAFELASSPLVGARVMGATMGRFAELTGSVDRLAALYPSGHSSGIHAQVFFEPTSARARNVMRTPRLVPFTLPIGTFVGREDGGRPIDWRELVVHSDGTRLRLHWPREDTEVHPFVPHMLALQGARRTWRGFSANCGTRAAGRPGANGTGRGTTRCPCCRASVSARSSPSPRPGVQPLPCARPQGTLRPGTRRSCGGEMRHTSTDGSASWTRTASTCWTSTTPSIARSSVATCSRAGSP